MPPLQRIRVVVARCTFPGYSFVVSEDHGRPQVRIECEGGTCNVTGTQLDWKGRWWRLSYHMTDGEIAQTLFKAVQTTLEHEARELFKVDDVTVFQPHFDLDALVAFASEPSNIREREAA